MLAAIEDDHLAGHAVEAEDGGDAIGNALGSGSALKRQFGKAAKVRLGRDVRRRHRRPGPDGVDPNARGKRLRQGARHGPQHGLRQRVAEIGRREVEHALVDDVDDVAGCALGELSGEIARQEGRGLGVDGEVGIPQGFVEIGDGIALKARGVVDEERRRAEEAERKAAEDKRLAEIAAKEEERRVAEARRLASVSLTRAEAAMTSEDDRRRVRSAAAGLFSESPAASGLPA